MGCLCGASVLCMCCFLAVLGFLLGLCTATVLLLCWFWTAYGMLPGCFCAPSRGLLGPCWAILGECWSILGAFGSILGPLWEHVGASWRVLSHLGPSWPSRWAKMALSGTVFAPKMGPRLVQNWSKNNLMFRHPFYQFWIIPPHFGVQNFPEMSQDGSRKRPKRAKIAKRCVFESMRSVQLFQ